MGFEAVVQFNHEGVGEHGTDGLLILYDVLLLIVTDHPLQHDLHRVELAVSQTTHQVDLAETTYCQTFADFVFLQPTLTHVLQTVESCLFGEGALSD